MMKNYLVITYDEKDQNRENPIEVRKLFYQEPADVMNFINPKKKYEIYKEIYLEITEEEA